jgi:hypothetical protein
MNFRVIPRRALFSSYISLCCTLWALSYWQVFSPLSGTECAGCFSVRGLLRQTRGLCNNVGG